MANQAEEPRRTSWASWGDLSKYRNVSFGLAIACIVLFHLYESTLKGTMVHSILWPFAYFSAAVDAFLFLSSMGLYFAFSNNSKIARFYKRRVLRIIPTFLVIALPFYYVKDFVRADNGADFLPDLFNISFIVDGYRQFWYIYAIILLYLLYPLLHRVIVDATHPFARTCIVIGATVALAIALGIFNPELLSKVEIMLTRFPAFVAGIYAGILVKSNAPMRGKQLLLLLAAGALLWVLMFTEALKFDSANLAQRYFYTCMAVLLCMLIPVILSAFNCSGKQRLLSFLGNISLELYIVNVAFRTIVTWYWKDYFFSTHSNLIQLEYCILVVGVSVLGAWLLHRVMEPINTWLLRRLDKSA